MTYVSDIARLATDAVDGEKTCQLAAMCGCGLTSRERLSPWLYVWTLQHSVDAMCGNLDAGIIEPGFVPEEYSRPVMRAGMRWCQA